MDLVYLLSHVRDEPGNDKVIGIYRSEAAATAAIERMKKKPGFSDYPDGFVVDKYKLDEDNWTEGFFTGSSGGPRKS
ncbi:MAG: hypothetical protein GC160_10550 [Acidobacteria bacterium]|nr:hypothetical protein [Acidobacteriota bacterium]